MHILRESFYKILMDSISDMLFVLKVINDDEFVYEFLNRAAMDRTKFKDIVGKSIYEVNSPEIAAVLYENYRKAAYNQTSVEYKDIYISMQGESRYSETTLTPFIDEDENCTYVIAVVKDTTNKINTYRKLEESEEHFRIIAENADDLITLMNNNGEIIFTSPSYKKVLGFNHKEYIGKLFLHNVHPDDRALVNEKVMQAIKNGEHFTVEFRQYNHENQTIWSEAHGSPVFDENKKLKHMVVVTRNINRQKRYESKLKHFALHDSLTGLPNRRLFKKHLTQELKRFNEKDDGLAVIMLDIDNFKDINDEMGHDIGDEVIEEYGKRLSKSIGETDIAARLGGDEFVILLPSITTVDNAILVVNKIQKAVQKPWQFRDNKPKVTTSIGISMANKNDTTPYSILKNADIALYEAKNAGGNTFKIKN